MDAKLRTLIDGGAAIVSPEWLDSVAQTDYGSEIRTAWNRKQIGTKDCFVAWIHPRGEPDDLEFLEGKDGMPYAVGSVNEPTAFTLANDPPRPKRATFHGQERTLQKVLIDGLDCLPGQQDLF